MLLEQGKAGAGATEAQAVKLLQTALALDVSLAEARYQLGNLALRSGRLPEAVQHLAAAAKLKPESSKIHYGLGRAYQRQGRGAEAAKEFQIFQRLKAEADKSLSGEPVTESKPLRP